MKSIIFGILGLSSLLFTVSSVVSPEIAFAKPPAWAPAHGYRRKHPNEKYEPRRDPISIVIPEVVNDRDTITFRTLDLNHDGIISRSEFRESDSLFERLDKNHDGILTVTEYRVIDEERGLLSGLLYKVKSKVSSFLSWLF
jgi:hypothetical protein